MRIQTCQYTNRGKRDPNEDAIGYFTNGDFSAWIAADGLGGHSHGELASAEAVRSLEASLKECETMDDEFVQQAFRQMNRNVMALEGPLTTAACAFSDGKMLYYGNNGDSRFLFIRGKKIIRHSNDHSLAYVAYKTGNIQYEEIPTHPQQNRLYHSLGNEIDFDGEFYTPIHLEPGDAFILCTDGFWELVTDNEMIRTLNIAPNPQEWLSMMLDFLEERLKSNSDNYSAVCVMIRED